MNQCVNIEITLSMLTDPSVWSKTQYCTDFRQDIQSFRETGPLPWLNEPRVHPKPPAVDRETEHVFEQLSPSPRVILRLTL